jgi:hypothetical protein
VDICGAPNATAAGRRRALGGPRAPAQQLEAAADPYCLPDGKGGWRGVNDTTLMTPGLGGQAYIARDFPRMVRGGGRRAAAGVQLALRASAWREVAYSYRSPHSLSAFHSLPTPPPADAHHQRVCRDARWRAAARAAGAVGRRLVMAVVVAAPGARVWSGTLSALSLSAARDVHDVYVCVYVYVCASA